MARPIVLAVALLATGGLAPTWASAQAAPAADSAPGAQWLKWDPATKTVTFELISGLEGGKSPFNFNGYTDGDANLIVPAGSKVVEGLPQEATDVMRFTAPDSGSFRIFCGVPGHGLSGMWIRFTVDPAAK